MSTSTQIATGPFQPTWESLSQHPIRRWPKVPGDLPKGKTTRRRGADSRLPRLWLKMRLSAKGKLAAGYRAGEGGFDGALLEVLGIDSTAAVAFVRASQPGYLAFEAWVKENAKPGSLTPEAIDQFNERILSFAKPEPGRSEMLGMLGLPLLDKEWLGSDLNDLDDWHAFHLALLDEE